MEEILASIRRIIADDGEGAEEREARAPQPEPDEDDAVLELTQRVDEHGAPVIDRPPVDRPAPAPFRPEPPPAEPLRAEPARPEPRVEPIPELPPIITPPPPAMTPPRPAPSASANEAEEDRLLSEESGSASARAFAEIASFTRARRDMLMGNGERTLEDLTRELLRPLLKDWLDQNLPGLVTRLVKEEIERMVRQGTSS